MCIQENQSNRLSVCMYLSSHPKNRSSRMYCHNKKWYYFYKKVPNVAETVRKTTETPLEF